ncbi:hypothetical protein GRC12_11115 [Streptomyces griseorubiginosus]|nr:hypothetical protein [Streptomyces griseorubiginosus]
MKSAVSTGVDPGAVRYLAARTAVEAHRLPAEALAPESADAEAELTMAQDAVRLAMGTPEQQVMDRLAAGSGA